MYIISHLGDEPELQPEGPPEDGERQEPVREPEYCGQRE